jgi:hypothetical protein
MQLTWDGIRAERRAAPKPARIPSGEWPMYSSDKGLRIQAERRAAPKPARLAMCERGCPREHRRPLGGPAKVFLGRVAP